jgi:cytidine deaminase
MRYGVTDSLVSAARAVQQQAYAPYSGYRVGAAVEADTGAVFAGCNVENASYGLTICAERAAVAAAVSAGVRRIRRAVVVTDSDPPAAPCGACRQVLSEFGADMTVEAVGPARTSRWSLRDLLPAAFGPEQLA